MLLSNVLRPTTEFAPDRLAVTDGERSWTHTELDRVVNRLARRWLADGLEAGDRVALLLPNRVEILLAYLACFQAGLIAVPLDYRYRPPQINFALRHSGSRMLLAHAERFAEVTDCEAAKEMERIAVGGPGAPRGWRCFEDLMQRPAEAPLPSDFRPDDLAVIFYTSGTTSRPKGVTMTRAALAAGTDCFLARVPLRSDDVALVAAPIARPFSLRTQVLPTLHAGGTVALLERFSPASYLAALRKPPAKTFLALIPSGLHQVVHHPDTRAEDFAGLRLCISGGDRVPAELHKDFRQLTGLELTEQCGMTEAGIYAVNPPFGRKKPGSIGLPMYGTQIRLLDSSGHDARSGQVGDILVHSPLIMDGYWNDTAQTRKALRDGWVHTGDLGRFDEDGYLWFMGRKKDIIIHDGANVPPAEIEETLLSHPAVAEACVVGVIDPVHGQNVHAFVTLRPSLTSSPTEPDLLHLVAEKLSRAWMPERIHIIPEMPRSGAGKIDRDRLNWRAEAEDVEL